jgi:hypothetical protein
MKKASPTAKVFFASFLTTAAGCSPVTFRSWRNRNGLFQQAPDHGGWNRFSTADIFAAAIVTDLTKRGMNAQTAVDIAMKALPVLEESFSEPEDYLEMLLVSFHDNPSKIEVSGFRRRSEPIYGVSPVYLLIDLDSIRIQMLKRQESMDIYVVDENGTIEKGSVVIMRLPIPAAVEIGVVRKKTVTEEDKKLAVRSDTKARVKKELGGSSRRAALANGPKWRPRAGG